MKQFFEVGGLPVAAAPAGRCGRGKPLETKKGHPFSEGYGPCESRTIKRQSLRWHYPGQVQRVSSQPVPAPLSCWQ